ncbi:MAG: S41 family peptidase [Clostridia bacterium]|nr:S41 family peptidase [Clostridia bacterium]
MKKGNSVVAVIIITALVTALLSYIIFKFWFYNYTLENGKKETESNKTQDNIFTQTLPAEVQTKIVKLKKLIDNYYLYEYETEEMSDMIAVGMLASLKDPYAQYYTKEAFKSFYDQTEGEYYGIGIYVTYDENRNMPIIIAPLEGSPAFEAGIQSADYIEYVGDLHSTEASYTELVDAIKGLPGTKIKIGLIRIDDKTKEEKHFEVEVERRKIEINPVKYEVLENNIGYIKLSSFDEVSYGNFKNAYESLINDSKVKSLIIDLRNNPGGVLDTCADITDIIVPEGKIVYTVDKEGKEEALYSDESKIEIPLVVLVNESSASATEVFTAAVKDYEVGTVIGKKTYGKGVVQSLRPLGDGTYVKLTTSEYFSPKGNKIDKIGVEPDIEVDLPEGVDSLYDIERDKDTQLQRAIDELSK